MEKIAIITDSDSNISLDEGKKLDIIVLSKPLSCGDEVIMDGVTFTYDEFLKELKSGKVYKSAQIAPQIVTDLFEETLKTYDYIIYIPISSKISKTYETSLLIEKEFNGRVKTIDARSVAEFQGYEVRLARRLVNEGKSFKEICDILENRGGNAIAYVVPETLTYLKRGGRITPAAAALGNLIGLKPILMLKDGLIDKFKAVRTVKKALLEVIEEIAKTGITPENYDLFVLHTNEIERANELVSMIKDNNILKDFTVSLALIPGVVLCHTGPGALAIGYTPKFQ